MQVSSRGATRSKQVYHKPNLIFLMVFPLTRIVCMSHCTCSTAYVTTSSLRPLPLSSFSTRRISLRKKSRKSISAFVFQSMMVSSKGWRQFFHSNDGQLPHFLYQEVPILRNLSLRSSKFNSFALLSWWFLISLILSYEFYDVQEIFGCLTWETWVFS